MSKGTPVQRIKVAGRFYVLLPLEEYQALEQAAKVLSASFRQPSDAFEISDATAVGGSSSLRAQRKAKGLSLQELAEMVGSSKPTLSQLENGRRQGGIDLWRKLANALGTSVDQIVPSDD